MSYNDLIVKFKQAQLVAREAYAAVAVAEHILRPDLESYLYAAKVRSEHGVKTELYGFCSGLAEGLVWDASRKLAPAGSKIDIARDDEMKEAGLDIREALERGAIPDLDGFWTYLERKFGGDTGRRVAYQQAAKAIIDGFFLRPDTEIRRVGGGVVINASVGSEASYVNRGLRRISTYSDQRVAALLQGLRAFARKSGFAQLAEDCNRGSIVRDDYASRDKLSLSGLEVTRFNDKWQFKFASQVGAALEIFISEFGAEHLASRAN
ncbi:hypothetical protein HHL24_26975 [Paraburkholderia sp. RP-4-7]|uniref:DUF4942 domain-containing protein n=1 Tax=Paraburkholderia polaris TaxID=2728848 RepID=A0A848IGQ3_9BURK|nr:hypothetical protein [Paraburkholderia polaris]NMM01568.1 hypothetical protein [Paraburkholderia polaris]